MTTWANPFQVNIHAHCIVCFLTKAQWIPRTLGKDSVYIKKIGLYASQNQKQTNRAKVVYWQRKTCFSSIGKQTKVWSFWRMSPWQAGPKSEGQMGPWEAGPSVLHGWCTQWGPSAFHGSYTSLRTHSVTWLQHFTEDPQPYRGILKVISVVGKSRCEILITGTWTRAMRMTESQMTTAPGF